MQQNALLFYDANNVTQGFLFLVPSVKHYVEKVKIFQSKQHFKTLMSQSLKLNHRISRFTMKSSVPLPFF